MKNAIRYLQILIAIWPEVTKLIKHIMTMLPEKEHIPATRHVLVEGKHMVNGDNHTILVSTWNRAREQQLRDFDLENI